MGALTSDEQLTEATTRAVGAVRAQLATLPKSTPVEKLTDQDLGWLASAAIFGWISARSEQAATFGLDHEELIHTTGICPDPWLHGAVAAALPLLADININWNRNVMSWDKEEMIEFASKVFEIVDRAMAARDAVNGTIVTKPAPLPISDDELPWQAP
jgi:hypothetical protein